MERIGIEPMTSGLQTRPIARPHLTPTDRIGMTEPYSAFCRTSPDTVRRRSARTALARPVPTWATIVRSSRTRARQSGRGRRSTSSYHGSSQATGSNRLQRFRLVSALSGPGRFAVDCHRLQPRGSRKAPSAVFNLLPARIAAAAQGRPTFPSGRAPRRPARGRAIRAPVAAPPCG
jgi:hypothetical protein